MSNNSRGLVMYDNDYIDVAKYICDYCSALVEIIDTYTTTLEEIAEKAIVDQKITSALANLSNQTAPLAQIIAEIGQQVANSSRDFVSEVDATDSFLY